MKWFKHDGNARNDEKIEKLLMKYGVDGYGLYFYCLEIIAGNLTTDNITFELKHDAEVIAYRLKMDTLRVEEIMKWMVEEGLFHYNRETERIVCLGLARRLDNTMSNNPEVQKLVNSKDFKELKETSRNFKSLKAEEKRREEKRREEENLPAKPANEPQWDDLEKSIENACLSQLTDPSQQYDYAKERKHVKQIGQRARNKDSPEEFIKQIFETLYRLKREGDNFWVKQPFLPSVINSKGIWPRILEEMGRGDEVEKQLEEMGV